MAGSLTTCVYKDDNATKYLVSIDTSNSNVTGSGFAAATQTEIDTLPALPKTLKMRYINCVGPGNVKRRIYVGSTTGTLWTHATTKVSLMVYAGGSPGTMQDFAVTSRIGEKQRYLFAGI